DRTDGIRCGWNGQVSTGKRDVKDAKAEDATRQPEQIKAFRDTWEFGIHSYLTVLRDRLTVARELLTESGSIFLQIGDENVHRVRAVMDEVFGEENAVSIVTYRTTTGLGEAMLDTAAAYIVWYAKEKSKAKYRENYKTKGLAEDVGARYRLVELPTLERRALTPEERDKPSLLPHGTRIYSNDNLTSQSGSEKFAFPIDFNGLK